MAPKVLWHLIDFGQSFYAAAKLNEQILLRRLAQQRNTSHEL